MWEEKFGDFSLMEGIHLIWGFNTGFNVVVFFSPQLFAPETHSACIIFVCQPDI